MTIIGLRIGNLVNLHGKQTYIDSVHFRDYYNEIDKEEDYSPIPLTEEWLIKFGFEKFPYIWKGKIDLDHLSGGFILAINGGEYIHGIPITSVHQLQNLCFALTGTELEIKDPSKKE